MSDAISPAADCKCGHPYSTHAGHFNDSCGVNSCPCAAFEELDSKLSHSTRCYCCGRPDHAAHMCPYVKGQKPQGW